MKINPSPGELINSWPSGLVADKAMEYNRKFKELTLIQGTKGNECLGEGPKREAVKEKRGNESYLNGIMIQNWWRKKTSVASITLENVDNTKLKRKT